MDLDRDGQRLSDLPENKAAVPMTSDAPQSEVPEIRTSIATAKEEPSALPIQPTVRLESPRGNGEAAEQLPNPTGKNLTLTSSKRSLAELGLT